MKNFFALVSAYLAAHPIIKNLADGLVKAGLIGAATYIVAGMNNQNAGAITYTGIGLAFLAAVKVYAQHALDSFLLGDATTTPQAKLAASKPVTPAVKMVLMLLFLGMASNVMAWELPSKPFQSKLKLTSGANSVLALPAGAENDIILLPTASLGLGVGESNQSYGSSFAYDLLLCHLSSIDANNANVTPYFGIGASMFVDMGPWLNSNLQSPVVAKFGANVIGPELQGIVPGIQEVWDLNSGARTTIVNANVPFGVFSDAAIIKVLGL